MGIFLLNFLSHLFLSAYRDVKIWKMTSNVYRFEQTGPYVVLMIWRFPSLIFVSISIYGPAHTDH